MPYFRITRRFATGGRLGHARIGPCGHIIYVMFILLEHSERWYNLYTISRLVLSYSGIL